MLLGVTVDVSRDLRKGLQGMCLFSVKQCLHFLMFVSDEKKKKPNDTYFRVIQEHALQVQRRENLIL